MKFERVIVGSFLVVFLFVVCSNYAYNEEYYTNSTVQELFFNYPNQIFISGIVTELYHDGFEVSVNNNGNFYNYKVKTQSKVDLGDTAQIVGTLNSHGVITAVKLFSVKNSDFNFVIIRSILGIVLFLIIFGRYWKFNLKKMLFIRRK